MCSGGSKKLKEGSQLGLMGVVVQPLLHSQGMGWSLGGHKMHYPLAVLMFVSPRPSEDGLQQPCSPPRLAKDQHHWNCSPTAAADQTVCLSSPSATMQRGWAGLQLSSCGVGWGGWTL